jgi:replicative DNA helicase
MCARARRLAARHGLDLLIVDYLQLLGNGGRDAGRRGAGPENRNQEITEIVQGLKALAKDLAVPIIALSQLSRAVERREDKRPMLSDLRDSGSLEAEADVVAMLYRPAYYQQKQDHAAVAQGADALSGRGGEHAAFEEAEVIIAKQRKGPTGTVKLGFVPHFARFENLTGHEA